MSHNESTVTFKDKGLCANIKKDTFLEHLIFNGISLRACRKKEGVIDEFLRNGVSDPHARLEGRKCFKMNGSSWEDEIKKILKNWFCG